MDNLQFLNTDKLLLKQLKQDDQIALKKIYDFYFDDLFKYSLRFVAKPEIAEELVQDAFIFLWNNRHSLEIKSSLKSFLLRIVRNDALDHLKSRYKKSTIQDETEQYIIPDNLTPFDKLHTSELQELLDKAMQNLPEKCAVIFELSRKSELNHKEIAEKLNISVKTVENQIGIALKKIREYIYENTN
jgi:RNA polymerase sigma-70 factor (ECF subfamily)